RVVLVDELVFLLRATDAMVVDALPSVCGQWIRRRRVPRIDLGVEEAALVARPSKRRALDSRQLIAEVLGRPNVAHAYGAPRGALRADRVGEISPVGRR